MQISRKAKRELALTLLLLCCIPLIYLLVFAEDGYKRLRSYQGELEGRQQQNLRLRTEHRDYLEKIDKLKNDPEAIERIARERYNFARPGDIIVELPP